MSFEALSQAVEAGNTHDAEDLTRIFLDEGKDPLEMIAALTETMNKLGELFERLEIFLPQLILAGEALTASVEILRPRIMENGEQKAPKGKVVIGVVKGDLHAIGKNIVKLMLDTNGFEVKDLGYDVDSLTFIKEAEAMGADIIGASSLMTTTMPAFPKSAHQLKAAGLSVPFICGGGAVCEEYVTGYDLGIWGKEASQAPGMAEDATAGESWESMRGKWNG